jgi:hypothetical protein
MNSNKKLYLYSGLAIALAVVTYVVITKKKPLLITSDENSQDDGLETPTGDTITSQQAQIPSDLSNILNKSSKEATNILKGKPIYTKLDNVVVRRENYVNNGFFNNIMSKINDSGFLLGTIIEVKEDKGLLKNFDGRIYKWFRIKPNQATLNEMNKNKDFLTSKFLPNSTGREIYVREDALKLK